eukprot:138357_1
MLLYKDIVTDDEIVSDAFKSTISFDGAVMNIASTRKVLADDGEIDIGCGNSFGGGDAEEDAADTSGKETIIDVVHNHNLQNFNVSRAAFKKQIVRYLNALKKKIKERVENAAEGPLKDAEKAKMKEFKGKGKKMMEFVTTVTGNFDDYEFYISENALDSDDYLIIPASYPDGAISPVFHILLPAVYEYKL